jgi:hypothetical protein
VGIYEAWQQVARIIGHTFHFSNVPDAAVFDGDFRRIDPAGMEVDEMGDGAVPR